MKKWRGIFTNPRKRFESKPITILNRFNQKSLKLPRIDDKKRWSGYPGITGISRRLADEIIKFNHRLYIEPLAGTGKLFQELIKREACKIERYILNDKSEFIYKWLISNFSDKATITNLDYLNCIKTFDQLGTLILFDQPWFSGSYDQSFSYFDRQSTKVYDYEIIDYCKRYIKGDFIITTRKENKRMLESSFNNYLIESEYVVCGKYPKTLITTNLILEGLEKAS